VTRAFHANLDATYSRFGFGRSVDEFYDDGRRSHHEPSSVTHLTRVDVGFAWSF
jgi:hypothetical protein